MPRIRTLKPEHRAHRKVGRLSDRTYRLWISCILEADDDGRLACDTGQLRAVTWPYRPPPLRAVERALCELVGLGLLTRYDNSATAYLAFPSWYDHQPSDRYHYRQSILPPPPGVTGETSRRFEGRGSSEPRVSRRRAAPETRKGTNLTEGNGTERKGTSSSSDEPQQEEEQEPQAGAIRTTADVKALVARVAELRVAKGYAATASALRVGGVGPAALGSFPSQERG